MPIARLLPIGDVKDGCFKFVKVSGAYRFAHTCCDHDTMVDEAEKTLVEAAGVIGTYDDEMLTANKWSMTLKKGCDNEHLQELSNLLGLKISDDLMLM